MTLRPDFDAHKRDVGDVRRRGRAVHRPVLAARRGRFAIVCSAGMPEGKVAYGRLCDLCCKPACDRIKRSAGRDSDLCDVVSRPLQSACSPLAKALSKALQSESRFYCRFSKRPTPCKGEVKMVLSRGTRFQISGRKQNANTDNRSGIAFSGCNNLHRGAAPDTLVGKAWRIHDSNCGG